MLQATAINHIVVAKRQEAKRKPGGSELASAPAAKKSKPGVCSKCGQVPPPVSDEPAYAGNQDRRYVLCKEDADALARWMRFMAQFRQAPAREEATDAILELLLVRKQINSALKKLKKPGSVPLTNAGVAALKTGKVSRKFFAALEATYQGLTFGKAHTFEVQREQWSTVPVRDAHVKKLTAWLIKNRIFTASGKLRKGKGMYLGNLDECPNPKASGASLGSASAYGTRLVKTQISGAERSENLTVCPFLLFEKELGVIATQVILKAAKDDVKRASVVVGEDAAFSCQDKFVDTAFTKASYQDAGSFCGFLDTGACAL